MPIDNCIKICEIFKREELSEEFHILFHVRLYRVFFFLHILIRIEYIYSNSHANIVYNYSVQ